MRTRRLFAPALVVVASAAGACADPRAPSAPASASQAAEPGARALCDAERAAELDARGELDAALAELAPCPSERVTALELWLELGEVERAQAIARTLLEGPAAARARAVLALSQPADSLGEARRLVGEAGAADAQQRTALATRLRVRARHALARLTGEVPNALAWSAAHFAGWARDRPVWQASGCGLATTPTASGDCLLVAELDGNAGAVAPLLVIDLAQRAYGTPHWGVQPNARDTLAVETSAGVAVFEIPGPEAVHGVRPRLLPATGTPVFDPKGELMLVMSDTRTTAFDTNTWSQRFEVATPIDPNGRFTADGAYVVTHLPEPWSGSPSHSTTVLDVRHGKVLLSLDESAFSAVSGTGQDLAVLHTGPDGGSPSVPWVVDLYDLSTMARHTVPIDVTFASGQPGLEFVDDGKRLLVQILTPIAHGDYDATVAAVIDVKRAQPSRSPAPLGSSGPAVRSAQDDALFARIERAFRTAIHAPRALVAAGYHQVPFAEADGLVAATAGTIAAPDCSGGLSYCMVGDPSIVIGALPQRVFRREVRLPTEGPAAVITVRIARRGQAVVACTTQGTFAIDVASGSVARTPGPDCYDWNPDPSGELAGSDAGVLDLRPPVTGSWPSFRAAPASAFCRFGALAVPVEVCPQTRK